MFRPTTLEPGRALFTYQAAQLLTQAFEAGTHYTRADWDRLCRDLALTLTVQDRIHRRLEARRGSA